MSTPNDYLNMINNMDEVTREKTVFVLKAHFLDELAFSNINRKLIMNGDITPNQDWIVTSYRFVNGKAGDDEVLELIRLVKENKEIVTTYNVKIRDRKNHVIISLEVNRTINFIENNAQSVNMSVYIECKELDNEYGIILEKIKEEYAILDKAQSSIDVASYIEDSLLQQTYYKDMMNLDNKKEVIN